MPNDELGLLSSGNSDGEVIPIKADDADAALRNVAAQTEADVAALAQTAREQLARDIAEIEHATAALRKADPGLESWTDLPAAAAGNPRPVWLLIGALWLSTALVTLGAVVAIATLVG
jgi:hypothetical protein